MIGLAMKALKAKKAMTSMQGKAQGMAQNIRQPVADWRDSMMGQMGGGAPVPQVGAGAAPVPGSAGWNNPNTQAAAPTGAAWSGDNTPGTGSRGYLQNQNMPDFLKDSPVGAMQQQLLAGLMDGDVSSRQFLNQDLANIRTSTQQAQMGFEGNKRFRGSGVGAAVGAAMGAGGVAQESRRMAQADQEELQRKLMISQGMSQGFTNPLMQSLGMGQQDYLAMMQRSMQEGMQPNQFSQGVGMATGLVGAFMCWVARAVLKTDRWLDARIGLIHEGSPALLSAYLDNGQALARRVDGDPTLRAELMPVFTDLADRGAAIRLARAGE